MIYLTVGTGIGVGVMVSGQLLHGMLHPEAGYILLEVQPGDEGNCVCPYHDRCFEGLAAGPSIEHRWGKKGFELADRPEVWDLESTYLAEGIATYVLCYSPQRIVLGGGVMKQTQLFPLVRKKVFENLNGYLVTPSWQTSTPTSWRPAARATRASLAASNWAVARWRPPAPRGTSFSARYRGRALLGAAPFSSSVCATLAW